MEPEILTGQALSDWIANRTGWPDSSAIALGRMLGAPQAARHLEPTGGVTVTGPSSVPGEKSTTSESVDLVPGTNTPAAPGSTNTEPGTKETTKEKTIELDYDGGQVKGTEKVTTITNITNNVTNITTTESSEQSTEDAEKSDFCKDNPGSLACAEMDTPEGEIPRSTFDVGYEIEDSWGGGACPADVYTTINGESVMVWDWVTSCGYIHTYVRPVLLALCAFGALMIIMPGRAEA